MCRYALFLLARSHMFLMFCNWQLEICNYLLLALAKCFTAAFSQLYVVQSNYDYYYHYWVKTTS